LDELDGTKTIKKHGRAIDCFVNGSGIPPEVIEADKGKTIKSLYKLF